MPTIVKRLSPIIVSTTVILLAAYLIRKPSIVPVSRRTREAVLITRGRLLRRRFRNASPVGAVMLVIVTFVMAFPFPEQRDSSPGSRATTGSQVSSRGGFRLPEIGVLGATPPPVPVIARPVGPPSPDPVLLAVARIALTPTPAPQPTSSPLNGRSRLVHRDLGLFRVTGYSDSPYLNGTDGRGITRSGTKTDWGCVAVDPDVIPLGTHLVIEDYESTVFTALDTGGGILGRWIDIWFPTDDDAIRHGLRELSVSVVSEE